MNYRSVNKTPKTKVLKIALDLFSSKGYSGTKMSDIAQRVEFQLQYPVRFRTIPHFIHNAVSFLTK